VFLSLCYVVLRRILQLVTLHCRSTDYKELEIAVLGMSSPSSADEPVVLLPRGPNGTSSRRRVGSRRGGRPSWRRGTDDASWRGTRDSLASEVFLGDCAGSQAYESRLRRPERNGCVLRDRLAGLI
jgi:hypothetical protein